MENLLEAHVAVLANVSNMFQEDFGVAIADKEKFIAYFPASDIDLKTKTGDRLKPEEALYKTIYSGIAVNEIVPMEIYGVPFRAITYPIKDSNGQIVGGVGISKNIEHLKKIESASADLFVTLEATTDNVMKVNDGMQSLFSMISEVVDVSQLLASSVKESDQIMSLIKKVAKQTNMLGLNAAIEASRAGTHGRGFTVVAEEMRNLALVSADSSEKVSATLLEMNHLITRIVEQMSKIEHVSKEQVIATEDMAAALEEITATSEILTDLTHL
ncbi:methyl-accepting chemotaxis protein [Fusibacter sp. 3D3]|uniref:methyl-accepting chemotaxis protein n=1 Tax=Fusibacter sp. 3D3 TaxID=1048380 RepID=UPI00085335F9|nr:methyl-accepting chemotaxis protein [Fusibacter sp. 3D3]GAU78981.1 methyl-accepting chemotaxis protein [Fusibacter sp. 3D3]